MSANGKSKENQGTQAAVQPFLGRELRIELTDGRIIVGTVIAFEGSGDLLLQSAVEQRVFKGGDVTCRAINLLAIPFKHVKALHRRTADQEPIAVPQPEAAAAAASA